MDQKHSILIVDDDKFLVDMYSQKFQERGFTVETAESGAIALSKIDAGLQPDICLVDIVMPEMDGFELLAEMRSRAEYRDIPALVLTAMTLTEEDRRRLNGEVERVVQKRGQTRDELLQEIGDALAVCVRRRNAAVAS